MEDIDYTDDFSKSRQNRPRMFFNTNDYEEQTLKNHCAELQKNMPYEMTKEDYIANLDRILCDKDYCNWF